MARRLDRFGRGCDGAAVLLQQTAILIAITFAVLLVLVNWEVAAWVAGGFVAVVSVAGYLGAEQYGDGPIDVVTYSSANAYARDAKRRAEKGWRVQSTSESGSRAKVGSKLIGAGAASVVAGPLGLATLLIPWRTKSKVTVTWTREAPQSGQGQVPPSSALLESGPPVVVSGEVGRLNTLAAEVSAEVRIRTQRGIPTSAQLRAAIERVDAVRVRWEGIVSALSVGLPPADQAGLIQVFQETSLELESSLLNVRAALQ